MAVLVHILLYECPIIIMHYYRKRNSRIKNTCGLGHLFLQIASTFKRVKNLKKQVKVLKIHRLQTKQTARIQ